MCNSLSNLILVQNLQEVEAKYELLGMVKYSQASVNIYFTKDYELEISAR